MQSYHNSFSPNCNWRGELACELTTPNAVELSVVLGEPKRGVLTAGPNVVTILMAHPFLDVLRPRVIAIEHIAR
jgi:hypothetical protein